MTKRILILGGDGLLGKDLQSYFAKINGFSVSGVGRHQLDITDENALARKIHDMNPNFVINCAAYTNVDKAEMDKNTCKRINVDGAGHVARVVSKFGSELIHISTASVFTSEDDGYIGQGSDYSPANYYSQTKVEAEQICREIFEPEGLLTIFRTYWLYGLSKPNFTTFVASSLLERKQIKIVTNQFGQPTSTRAVFQAIIHRIESRIPIGIYSATNAGSTSRIGWAQAISELLNVESGLVESVDEAYFAAPAQRPFNTSLDHQLWSKHGIEFPDWKIELNDFLRSSYSQ